MDLYDFLLIFYMLETPLYFLGMFLPVFVKGKYVPP